MSERFRLPAGPLPPGVARILSRLPQQPPTLVLVTALNLALGRILPRESLEPLEGRRMMLVVTDAGMRLRFSLGRGGFVPLFDNAEPALKISATARDYVALLLREEDPDTLFFNRRLLMEGDTELGLLVKNTLDAIEPPRLDFAALAPTRLIERLMFGR